VGNENVGGMQISITTSTSAGLEQILPWLYYHRVIGVTNFFLFVESKAASPHSTAVLEAIPVCCPLPFCYHHYTSVVHSVILESYRLLTIIWTLIFTLH
jgi:hypothetical protein